jgi:REP element-mobilizing transposase RayT
MARKPRHEVAGAVHHVFARGNRRQRVYLDHTDYATYLRLLAREVRRRRWRCLAYCLMENHLHLLVETPEPNLGRGMQRLHGDYAHLFNQRHDRVGHLFQGRYGAVAVETDDQLIAVVRYIAANPVEASLCARAEQWRWNSFGLVLHGRAPSWLAVDRLFEYLAADGADPRTRYGRLVSEQT